MNNVLKNLWMKVLGIVILFTISLGVGAQTMNLPLKNCRVVASVLDDNNKWTPWVTIGKVSGRIIYDMYGTYKRYLNGEERFNATLVSGEKTKVFFDGKKREAIYHEAVGSDGKRFYLTVILINKGLVFEEKTDDIKVRIVYK